MEKGAFMENIEMPKKNRKPETRRSTRNHVLNTVFLMEFLKDEKAEALDKYYDAIFYEENMELENENSDFVPNIINKKIIENQIEQILKRLDEIDNLIKKNSVGWDISRIDKMDLAIIRLAIYEMLFDEDVPKRVAINEAVELAKIYSSEKSYKFINGILAKI